MNVALEYVEFGDEWWDDFSFELLDTEWGVENSEEVIIEGTKLFKDGDDCFDEDGDEGTIKNWEDCIDDMDARWESDSLSEFDYIDHQKINPLT